MKAIKSQQRNRRHSRIRAKVKGDSSRPRLSVFRSNKFVYAQIIDDEKGATLVSATDKILEPNSQKLGAKKSPPKGDPTSPRLRGASKKLDRAKAVGEAIAMLAKEKKIDKVVFDRGGFLYAGRVKALAEGARSGGLKF